MDYGSAYSPEQISQFLDHISFPEHLRHADRTPRLLDILHKHTISKVPYENLSLHYGATHRIDLDPQLLFRKIVVDARGRGGYCMENATFYNHVLRGMGFNAYTAPAKNRTRIDGVPQGPWVHWIHCTNIVVFPDGRKFSSDVGFGGDGPTMPLALDESAHIHTNLGAQQIRLVHDWLPLQRQRDDPTRRYWIYQYRNGPERDWNSFYAFYDVEFFAPDFEPMNYWVDTNAGSIQSYTPLVVLFLTRAKRDGEKGGGEGDGALEVYGKRMLVGGLVKENLGGRTAVVHECGGEADRVEALRRWFGMELSLEEKEAIRGWKTELK